MVRIGKVEIAVYGLNSAWFCASDSDRNRIAIGEYQARDVVAQNTDADLRIALVHHPFDWLLESDRKDSEDFLKRECDFILHGHRHRQAFMQEKTPSGETFVFASGPGYDRRDLPNACNLVTMDLDSGKGSALSLRYSDEGSGFWTCDTQSDPGLDDGVYDFERSHPFVPRERTATPDPEAQKALSQSPSDYTEYIKKTGQLHAVSSADLRKMAMLSPGEAIDLLVWLVTQDLSLATDLVAETGSRLEQALSRSPADLDRYIGVRNELVHVSEISSEIKQGRVALLAVGAPGGGKVSKQVVLQIPAKDTSQPMRAERLALSLYLANESIEPIRNPIISLTATAPFLAYPYRGGGFTMEPSEYWQISKPSADSIRCLYSLPPSAGMDLPSSATQLIGTASMLIPWGEADSGPVDLDFGYQIKSDNIDTERGTLGISIMSALTFESASGVHRFSVPADRQEEIDTGLHISKGRAVQFAARGVVSLDARRHFVNPDGLMCDELGRLYHTMPGVFQQYASPGELLNGHRAGVLLGWLGDWEDGDRFYVGSSSAVIVESEGSLHLAVNDSFGAYEDNSGEFEVLVHVR